jgi:hypothetical protein
MFEREKEEGKEKRRVSKEVEEGMERIGEESEQEREEEQRMEAASVPAFTLPLKNITSSATSTDVMTCKLPSLPPSTTITRLTATERDGQGNTPFPDRSLHFYIPRKYVVVTFQNKTLCLLP